MKTTATYLHFRKFLQDQFLEKINKNSSYSLRGYARFLGINDSTLSKILDGKMKISKKRFEQLSSKFNLTIEQIKKFNEMGISSIEEDHFKLISEWYHFAILELIKTKSFKTEPSWIAKRLNISVNKVNIALERLLELGLVQKNENESFELLSPNNKWDGDRSTVLEHAHRGLQEQIIKKSLDTLNAIPSIEKENSSLTVACKREIIPEVKNKIKKFKRELDEYIMSVDGHDDVYQLSISFFPLTNKVNNTGE